MMNDTEETVRHLFAVATEDIPPGIDLLRAIREQQSRARSRRRTTQVRVAISAGTAAVVAATAAITLSAVQAPSALAQVTRAAAVTAGQSYHVRSVARVVKQAKPGASMLTVTLNGEFDPARGVGEETSSTGSQVRFVGGYMYLSLSDPFRTAYQKAQGGSIPAGKSWVRFPAPLRPGGEATLINLTQLGIGTPDLG